MPAQPVLFVQMKRGSALALLFALAIALVLRVPRLDIRPFHNDEAVNAVKVVDLWQHGRYVYDPDEYHGPTLHYATLPVLWLSDAHTPGELSDAMLRVAPVVFGVGLVLLLLLFVDGLGRAALVWAALFTAISPAMVFYSRYFIHEMLLVFFTGLTLGGGWRYTQKPSVGWAALTGAGLGLMFATKETFVLPFGAMVIAGALTAWRSGRAAGRNWRTWWNPRHAAIAWGATLLVWLIFFSSFGSNFAGLLDSVRTYLPWLKRAGGHSPHIHPWNFYFERLAWFHPAKSPVWSEGLILLLAAVGAVVALVGKRSPWQQFLALYTIILTAVYCAISYKTPWCLLGFFHGMILLAGIGAAALVQLRRAVAWRFAVTAILLGLTGQLAWQAWRASVTFAADRRNPYVYAQTVPDLLNLVERANGLARVASAGYDTVVKVVAPQSDYWPLPWYLRRFAHVGWYDALPADPFAPIVIVSTRLNAQLDEKSERKWIMAGISEMRPGVFFELYVELELWKKFVETLPRERD